MGHYAYRCLYHYWELSPSWIERYRQEIADCTFGVINDFIFDYHPITTEKPSRVELFHLLDNVLTPEDTLTINHFHDFGNSISEIVKNLERCQELLLPVYLIRNPGIDVLSSKFGLLEIGKIFSRIESNVNENKKIKRKEIANSNYKLLGRPYGSKFTSEIIRLKQEGYKQKEVARILNISLSTVQRYWRKLFI
ncbi:helix-turn-helix domain-containing protein [Providencia rettgeri]|nr:helix-turn-helix domain-containing protein [Providencia rettgeri]